MKNCKVSMSRLEFSLDWQRCLRGDSVEKIADDLMETMDTIQKIVDNFK